MGSIINNRNIIFVEDQDYQFYLEKLAEACKRFECELHAYGLMTNHVHLLITPHHQEGISEVMQSLGRYYVQYFNYQYHRTGTLWEGRYKATLLDSEHYLLTCYRYIELNPVRAGMVDHPSDYPWTSYHHNARGHVDERITPHILYQRLGLTPEEREQNYRQLFRQHLSEKVLTEIRAATNQAWVLGNDRFKRRIEKWANRQATPRQRGGDRKSKAFQEQINRV